MKFFSFINNSLLNAFIIFAFVSCASANIPVRWTLKTTSSACSALFFANGSNIRVEVVSNVSMTTIWLWEASNLLQSLYLSMCNTPTLEIQSLNSNVSFNLHQNQIQIRAINLSSSWIKFQNGTFIAGSSIFVPEFSLIDLDYATLTTAIDFRQANLTIQGTLFLYYWHLQICIA